MTAFQDNSRIAPQDGRIGPYSVDEFVTQAEAFHGYAAPGLILGGFMVHLAMRHLPAGILFDAISETKSCLPDAVQLLTPCTIGNGWLKVLNLGRYAVTLYDKRTGHGVRVAVTAAGLQPWRHFHDWFYNLVDKKDQVPGVLLDEIKRAGTSPLAVSEVLVREHFRIKRRKGRVADCPACGEPYPVRDGGICRGCQGEVPYEAPGADASDWSRPPLAAVPVAEAVGQRLLHDMTQIIPGQSKGPAFVKGQTLGVGDLCRLQQMGRNRVYVDQGELPPDWVHENEAAIRLATALAGEGVTFEPEPREGKINLRAAAGGLLRVDGPRLEAFNGLAGVVCASRRDCDVVEAGMTVAAVRAIPLLLPRRTLDTALAVLAQGPVCQVLSLRPLAVAILVTGTEVFQGKIKDRFEPIIRSKVEKYGCPVVAVRVVADEAPAIATAAEELLAAGAQLLITTAGLSVDPDDVTRLGLEQAGLTDAVYGAPILPGAMTLVGRMGQARVMGVPACALYFKTTSFDVLLPRVLTDLPITRQDLAPLGLGGLCRECAVCVYPKCGFGH